MKLVQKILTVVLAILTCMLIEFFWRTLQSKITFKGSLREDILGKTEKHTFFPSSSTLESTNNIYEMASWSTKKKVIIFARMRTGSSFIGSLFGKNPSFYYAWEPFQLYPTYLKKDPDFREHVSSQAINILSNILGCHFQPYIKDIMEFKGNETHTNKLSKVFWRKRLCRFMLYDCPMDTEALSESCENDYKHVATKLITLPRISTLTPLLFHDVKVISLFRDPRAVMASLLKLSRLEFNSNRKTPRNLISIEDWKIHAKELCSDMESSLDDTFDMLKHNGAASKNIKPLRFEDVALNPNSSLQDIYNFVGLEVPNEIWQYLKDATSKNTGFKFSTYRKSDDIPLKWLQTLSWERVNELQNTCSKIMERLGYEILSQTEFDAIKALFKTGNFTLSLDDEKSFIKKWDIQY